MNRTEQQYTLATFSEGHGKSVLLLHGQISTHNYMSLVADELKGWYHVTSLDLLGFGDSPRPRDCTYSVDEHVKAIMGSLPAKGPPIVVVGHSMGAQIAVRLAKSHPSLVRALVLSALPLLPKRHEYKTLAKEFPGTRLVLRGPHAKLLRRWYERNEARAQRLVVRMSRHHYGHFKEVIRADSIRHSWEAYHRSMKQVVIGYDVLSDLKQLSQPVMLMYGENDQISKDIALQVDSFRPNIEVIPITDAGHNLPLEHPELVAKAVLSV